MQKFWAEIKELTIGAFYWTVFGIGGIVLGTIIFFGSLSICGVDIKHLLRH